MDRKLSVPNEITSVQKLFVVIQTHRRIKIPLFIRTKHNMRIYEVSPFIRMLAVTLVLDISVELQCEDKCNSLLLSQLANLLLDQKLNLPNESISARKLFALNFNARTNVTVRCFCWLPSCSWTGSSACQLNESTSVRKLFVLGFSARTNISLLLLQVANLFLGRKLSVQNESISVRELQCEDRYNSLLLLQVASWLLDQKLSV